MSEILLRYTQSEKFELLLASTLEDTFDVLLKWLDKQGIAFVDSVPDKPGLFCVPQKPSYGIYQSIWNESDNMFNSYLIYSLQWLPWFGKDAREDKKPEDDIPAAPVLVREI